MRPLQNEPDAPACQSLASTTARSTITAAINPDAQGLQVLTLSIDSLALPHTVRLVKIDAEGHELSVLKGMVALLARDRPTLIIEVSGQEVHSFLEGLNYSRETIPNSPNHIYRRS